MNLSRERHIGNRTKLQLRFSTDADALPMHRPSWRGQTPAYRHVGKMMRHELGIIIVIIVVVAVVIVLFLYYYYLNMTDRFIPSISRFC